MRIMQTIQARYGDHIPMAAILEHPSVDRLVAHLHQSYVLPDAVPAPEGTPDRARATAPPGAEPHPEVKVVPFADAPEGTPAYCLFGETGELSWVMNLCGHLAQEGPVIGLEAPGFDTGTAPSGDIGHLARQCADAIMERHTEGACRVVGQGVAGYVAAETARLLQDRGFEISELLLLGTPEPGEGPPHETPAASVAEVAASFAAVWGAPDRPFGADEPEDRGVGDRVAEAAARLGSHAPMDGPTLRRWLETAARWRSTLVRSARTYHARPLSGTGAVCVVRAASRARSTPGSGYDRWIAPPPVIHDLDLEPWQLPSPAGARDTARSRAARPALAVSQEEQPSPVVAINRHGDDKRSVWAHNLYGEVSYAIYLSRHLGPRTPVIGLEQTGMAAPVLRPREYASVEEMAAHYAGELRAQFPGESFLLGGCSFGGVLAYEMARKLQQEGEEVSHLIAIDPIMPATEAWDSVDWGTVTAVEAEAFSVVMLGNAMCQRWGVAERVPLASLSGLALDGQLDVVARHIHDRSPARPDPELIRQQILVRHEVMLRNGDLLQAYRPKPLERSVPTTLFHATQGFLAPDNDNELPAVPRTSDDKSNGFAAFVGDRLTIHEMAADHHTIAHNENLALISAVLAPLLRRDGSPGGLFPASLSPDSPQGSR